MPRRAFVARAAAVLCAASFIASLTNCQEGSEPVRRLVLADSGIPVRCTKGADAEFDVVEDGERDWFGLLQPPLSNCRFELVVPERSRLAFRVSLDRLGRKHRWSATIAIHSVVGDTTRALLLHELHPRAPALERELELPAGTSTLVLWAAGPRGARPSGVVWSELEIRSHSPDKEDGLPWIVDVERGLVPYLETGLEIGLEPTEGEQSGEVRPRLLVVGVDGASWALMERLLESGDMPALAALRARGRWGVLRSTLIPESGMGWSAIRTGVNPGKNGMFSFYSGSGPRRPFWQFLGDRGLNSVIVAVPTSWPKRPVRGVLIGGWSWTVVLKDAWAWPPELLPVLERVGYRPALHRERNPDYFVAHMRKRTEVAAALLRHTDWDLGFVVYEYTDSVGHHFGLHTNEWDQVYRALDANLARLLEFADERTTVLVISDHGWKQYERSIHLNAWLRKSGFKDWAAKLPASGTALTISRGDGIVAPRPASRTTHLGEVEQIEAGLAGLVDPDTGKPVIRRTLRSEQAFSGRFASGAPGRLIVQASEDYHLTRVKSRRRRVRRSKVFGGSSDTHSYDGIYLIAGSGIVPGKSAEASIYDVAPTVLRYFGVAPPADSDGESLIDFAGETAAAPTELYFAKGPTELRPSEEEVSKDFEEDLRSLGYIE